jgi:hypothetical protein
MVKIKVSPYGYNWVRGIYQNDSSTLQGKITLQDIKFLVGKNRTFEVCSFWGGSDMIKFTITEVEENEYGYFMIHIKASDCCPDRFYPSISEILGDEAKEKNLLFPISYQVL